MKKLLKTLLLTAMMICMGASLVFAASNADKETLQEGADISSIHRLAIGSPLYTPAGEKPPTKDELTQAIFDGSKAARMYVISYPQAAQSIAADTGTDITALDRRQAAKIFKDNIGKYADAYVIVTVANDSRTVFFYDVYKASTNDLLYTYQIVAEKSQKNSVEGYRDMSKEFYKHFEAAANKKAKEDSKKK